MNKNIIAIDGPAGAGKGTLTKKLCEYYKLAGLDTGSLYRAITLCMLENNFPIDNINLEEAVKLTSELSETHKILEYAKNPKIRSQLTNKYVATVAKIPELRQIMRKYQIDFANNPPTLSSGEKPNGAIIEGRDIGTVICPFAPVKFFLNANPESRAERRYQDYITQGEKAVYDDVLSAILERDRQDATRAVSPMKAAEDAIFIDTTINDIEETFNIAKKIIDERLELPHK